MVFPVGRSYRTRLALACTLFLAAVTSRLEASDRWAEQFTASFSSQIVNVVDGIETAMPGPDSAALRTVAGLNVGDPIVIDASDGTQHEATVVDVNTATHWVIWTPAMTAGITAKLNGFVASPYALSYPKQSAIDAAGRIYTIDTSGNRVVVFSPTGQILWTLGEMGRVYSNAALGIPEDEGLGPCDPACPDDPASLLGKFVEPNGIDVSRDGKTIVIGDSGNHRIQVFHENAGGSIQAIDAVLAGPRFDAYAIGGFGDQDGTFNFPGGVSLYPSATDPWGVGRIAVADSGNNRIQVFTPSAAAGAVVASDQLHGFTLLRFGKFGTALPGPDDVRFFDPEDVEFDRSGRPATDGRLVVADAQNNRIQIFDGAGRFVHAIQSDVESTRNPGDFNTPQGVTVDETGRIYVADTGNNRIQVFTPSDDGSSYELKDPATDVFGAQQQPDPLPGEIPFLGPTGVAVGTGQLIVTEIDGQRLKVLTRTDLAIDAQALTVSRTSVTVQDTANDTVHVTVPVRNIGGVDLEDVTLSATTTVGGLFSSVVPSHVDLARAGAINDAAIFEFDFKVTAPGDGSTLHFDLSAIGHAGTVVVEASVNVDSQVVVIQPAGPAIALGTVVVTPMRVGLNQHITVTVPVRNIGGETLSNVRVTATPDAVSIVTPATDSELIASLPRLASETATFDFTALAVGVVRFNITVIAEDPGGQPVPRNEPLETIVPALPGVRIVSDNSAPTVSVVVTPPPNPRSADGKDWFNGSATPCAAQSCPPPAVLTWPSIHVVAEDNDGGSGVKRIGWRMVDTSNQPQSDEFGACSRTSGSIRPSVCTPVSASTLLWDRTLAELQKRIVLAIWAEDQEGNGAATVSDELLCLGTPSAPPPPGVIRINRVTCVTLFIDVEPPILAEDAITLSNDNSEARIAFTGGDRVSLVSGMMSPDALLEKHGAGAGELVLHSEGVAVTATVVVTDFARNSAVITLPFIGPRKPVIRLDHTPPEAFNRIDVTALGKRCATTISGQPVRYACTNKVYGTDNLPGLMTAAFAPSQVVPARWGGRFDNDHREEWDGRRDDDDHHRAHREEYDHGRDVDDNGDDDDDRDDHGDWDGRAAELQTYTFTDAFVPESGPAPIQNPNRVTIVEKVRQSGNEARVRVMSYRYQRGSSPPGPVIIPDWAYKKYEWARNSDGSLKSLLQKFELYKGRHRVQVMASYDVRTNRTRIVRRGPGATKVTASGLILLRLASSQGTLTIDYDLK